MPIYAYRCEGCGFQKDALQKMSDAPLVDCPACGEPKLAKQVTAAGFALKGSGWYVTDFRDSGKKPAAPSTAPAPDASKPSDAASSSAPAPVSSPSESSSAAPSAASTAPSTSASASA